MARTPIPIDNYGNFIYQRTPVNIDEELLQKIASLTGGKYFRATDNQKLSEIYTEIDQLEKTKLQDLKYYSYDEEFNFFALWALAFFCFELLLRYSILKSFV